MQSPIPAAAAFTAAQRALANPATQRALANPATQRALVSGFQRAGNAVVASSTGSPSPPAPPSRSVSSTGVDNNDATAPPPINFGRVAAAAQAFSAPPRAPNPPAHKQPDAAGGLVPQKVCTFFFNIVPRSRVVRLTAW